MSFGQIADFTAEIRDPSEFRYRICDRFSLLSIVRSVNLYIVQPFYGAVLSPKLYTCLYRSLHGSRRRFFVEDLMHRRRKVEVLHWRCKNSNRTMGCLQTGLETIPAIAVLTFAEGSIALPTVKCFDPQVPNSTGLQQRWCA